MTEFVSKEEVIGTLENDVYVSDDWTPISHHTPAETYRLGVRDCVNVIRDMEVTGELPPKSIAQMMSEVVAYEHLKGWQPNDNRFLESLALLHSEVSEALEAYRDKDWGSIRESDRKPEGVASELADVFMRTLSTWAQFLSPLGHDLEEQFDLKMAYNRNREWRHGGRTI